MQHYRIINGRYTLHAGLPTSEGEIVKDDQGGTTQHERVSAAYYESTLGLATHGSPEGMKTWAAVHNGHSPHKVRLYHFDPNTPVDTINAALLDPSILRKMILKG